MKVLVIGGGGREHALVHTFYRQGHTVYAYPGNPGIFSLARRLPCDGDDLIAAVKGEGIDLTVVGPEAYLEKGIQDLFASHGLALFGPSKQAAQLETNKGWAKAFMEKYDIPTPSFQVCRSAEEARLAAKDLFSRGKRAVIKASGLAGGKGVVCSSTYEEAEVAIRQMAEERIYGNAGSELVVEELIAGPELSLQVICDGETMAPLLAAQDHKRLLDCDLGPNTGGMGAYAPLPFLSAQMKEEIREKIVEATLKGLQREGIVYRGVLYFGLMLTETGPQLLEYNCRFGDPEAEAILPLFESDLAALMMSALRGELHLQEIRYKPMSSCVVILASKGYPTAPELGKEIALVPNRDDLIFFHAGTAFDPEGRVVTAGGRALAVTAIGVDLEEAIQKAYAAIDETPCSWAHFRRDIGRSALLSTI